MPDGQPDQSRFDSNSPVLWHQIAAMLRKQIEDGELAPGQRAPSITALVQGGHAKSRPTCAKALKTPRR